MIKEENLSLLGDSAYPYRWYLLTPYDSTFVNMLNDGQGTFQRRILATRQNVEQTIGILKQRFNVLLRPARYELTKVPKVFIACCVLHNICRKLKIPAHPSQLSNNENDSPRQEIDSNHPRQVDNAVRQNYIDQNM